MLRHAGEEMGIMVLNGMKRQADFSGELGRTVIGVEIADDGVGE